MYINIGESEFAHSETIKVGLINNVFKEIVVSISVKTEIGQKDRLNDMVLCILPGSIPKLREYLKKAESMLPLVASDLEK